VAEMPDDTVKEDDLVAEDVAPHGKSKTVQYSRHVDDADVDDDDVDDDSAAEASSSDEHDVESEEEDDM